MNSTFVEKQLGTLTAEAAKTAGDSSLWADAALLRIQDRLKDKQKAKGELSAAFDAGWGDAKRRAQLIDASVAANKVTGVRAGNCMDHYSAHQGVEHDDMNVLVLGGRVIGVAVAEEMMRAFLAAKFTGEPRHRRRLDKVLAIERTGGR